jgi:hypothetical protein
MGNHADKSGDPDTDSGLGELGQSCWIGPDWFDQTVWSSGTIVTLYLLVASPECFQLYYIYLLSVLSRFSSLIDNIPSVTNNTFTSLI